MQVDVTDTDVTVTKGESKVTASKKKQKIVIINKKLFNYELNTKKNYGFWRYF